MNQPLVSIIIPCRKISEIEKESVEGCLALNWPNIEIFLLPDYDNIETNWPNNVRIIATGPILPAEKRNIGIAKVNGEYIAFIDSDAYPRPDWLNNAIPFFSDSNIGIVGGPSLRPPKDDICRQASGIILSSKIGGGTLSKRYSTEGTSSYVDDMPSSNMIVPKSIIQKIGGFNANYWPGEDTYLCMQIKKDLRMQILYSPKVAIYHHPRRVFRPHLQQIWSYGLHRGYFAKKIPSNSRHITYFIPSFFVLFNVIGIVLSITLSQFFLMPYSIIIGSYCIICIVTGLKTKNLKLFFLVTAGIPLTHVVYGIGFLKGFFSVLEN